MRGRPTETNDDTPSLYAKSRPADKLLPETACTDHYGIYNFQDMKRPQLVSQGSLNRMLQAAEEFSNARDFTEAIDTAERASRLDPANFSIWLCSGHLYGLRYDYEAAKRCPKSRPGGASKNPALWRPAGEKCRGFANNRMAEMYFKRALEQKDVSAEACVKAAEFYERVRRIEDANQLVERALQMNKLYAPALLARARLDRHGRRLEEAERQIRTFLKTADRATQIRGWYELGEYLTA